MVIPFKGEKNASEVKEIDSKKNKSLPKCSIPEVFIKSELGRGNAGGPPVKYSMRTSAGENDDL